MNSEADGRDLDAADPLSRFREHFHVPPAPDGRDAVYLACHPLAL